MIGLFDWGISLIWIILLSAGIFIYASKSNINVKAATIGFWIKCIGAVAFTYIYVYYYGFGDTFEYYRGAKMLGNSLLENPQDYLDLLSSSASKNFPVHLKEYTDPLVHSDSPEEWFFIKLTSPLALLSFNSMLGLNVLMAFIAFIGNWKIYEVFNDVFPNNNKKIIFAFSFCIPSVVFWGSGLMKDTLTLAGLYYVVYYLYFGIVKGQFKLIYLIGGIIWCIIIFKLKSYILISFFPSILLVFYFKFQKQLKDSALRFIVVPFLLIAIVGVGFIMIQQLAESSEKYALDNLEWKAKGFHTWHESLGGSAYNLGEIEYTATGVLRKIPAALNVTYFRPYPWEAGSPIVLLTSIESLLFFLVFVYIIFRYRFKIFTVLRSTVLLRSLVAFILIFGFAVGFTSYNFGALVRYKMPVMVIAAFTFYYMISKKKNQLTNTKSSSSSKVLK